MHGPQRADHRWVRCGSQRPRVAQAMARFLRSSTGSRTKVEPMTTALAKGVARISFPGGGTVLPAESAYDWEILMEYVADNVRSGGQFEICVDDQCWVVRCVRGPSATGCSRCGHALHTACCSATNAERRYCGKCLGASTIEAARPRRARRGGASCAR